MFFNSLLTENRPNFSEKQTLFRDFNVFLLTLDSNKPPKLVLKKPIFRF